MTKEQIPRFCLSACPSLTAILPVLKSDNGPAGSRRTGTATVYVEVLDVNDNRPIFLQNSYETSVLETIPHGTNILQVHLDWHTRSRNRILIPGKSSFLLSYKNGWIAS